MATHLRSILPQRGGVSPVDNNTVALFHYDSDAKDSVQGVRPVGETVSFVPHKNNGYIKVDNINFISSGITIQAWAKINTATEMNYLFDTNSDREALLKWSNSDTTRVEWGAGSSGYKSYVQGDKVGKWTHYAITYDESTEYLYIDGVQVDSQAGGADSSINFTTLFIGEYKSLGYSANANISSFSIWNRALSEAEIKQTMNNSFDSISGLFGYWKLNEGEGQIAYDYSSSGNDGVVNNGEWSEGQAIYSLVKDSFPGGTIKAQEATENLLSGKLEPTDYTKNGYNGYYLLGISNDNPRNTITTGPTSIKINTTYTFSAIYWSSTGAIDDVYIDFGSSATGYPEGNRYMQPFRSGHSDSQKIQDLGSNWKHCSGTFTTNDTSTSIISVFFDSDIEGQEVFIANIQIEEKPYATEFTPGKRSERKSYGGGVLVEEGTTNLLPQDFRDETAEVGWDARANVDVWYDEADPLGGNSAVKIKAKSTYTGGDVYFGVRKNPSPGSGTFTFSAWMKADASITVPLIIGTGSTTDGFVRHDANLTTEWQEVVFTGSYSVAASHTFHIGGWSTFANLTNSVWMFQPQVEAKPYATSFVDGSRGAGLLKYHPINILNTNEGTISLWVKRSNATNSYKNIWAVLEEGKQNENRFSLEQSTNTEFFYLYTGDTTSSGNASSDRVSIPPDEWVHIACTWNNGTYLLYKNGVVGITFTPSKKPVSFDNSILQIGSATNWTNDGAQRQLNGIIDELRIDKVARTEAEIQAWYYQGRTGWE